MVSASFFANEVQTGNGKRRIRNVNLQRRCREGDEWKPSTSFGLGDLPNAIRVLQLAQDYVEEKEADTTN